jgi:hypothetical protein
MKSTRNVRLALRSAREIGLMLYPLGTYPLPLEPTVREELDYRVQVRTVGPERFMDAGGCARTHLHLELRAGTVDTEHVLAPAASEGTRQGLLNLYNLATALDPALIFLTRSCPFFEGRATGALPPHLPLQGQRRLRLGRRLQSSPGGRCAAPLRPQPRAPRPPAVRPLQSLALGDGEGRRGPGPLFGVRRGSAQACLEPGAAQPAGHAGAPRPRQQPARNHPRRIRVGARRRRPDPRRRPDRYPRRGYPRLRGLR